MIISSNIISTKQKNILGDFLNEEIRKKSKDEVSPNSLIVRGRSNDIRGKKKSKDYKSQGKGTSKSSRK